MSEKPAGWKIPKWAEARRAECDERERADGVALKVKTYDEQAELEFQRERLRIVRLQFEKDLFDRATELATEVDARGNGVALLQYPDGRIVRAIVNKYVGRMWSKCDRSGPQ